MYLCICGSMGGRWALLSGGRSSRESTEPYGRRQTQPGSSSKASLSSVLLCESLNQNTNICAIFVEPSHRALRTPTLGKLVPNSKHRLTTAQGSPKNSGIPAHHGFPGTVAAVKKARIDAVLAERGLFPSRTAAAGAVRAGAVRVGGDGPVALRPSQLVEPDAELVVDAGPRFVSRGGIKLENALTRSESTSPAATASTSAPRPAASPTACCSAARRGSPPSTSPTGRSTSACARIRG